MPLRDQRLVGTSHPAQFRDRLPLGLILLAVALSRAERQPRDLGQQVGAIPGDPVEFRHPGRFVGLGQPAPPGMPAGDTVQPGDEQPVAVRCTMITSHLASIEHRHDKRKNAGPKASFIPVRAERSARMSVLAVTVSCMDVGVIVYIAELEAPGLRETAQRILLAEAGKLGVLLGRSEALRRRAQGGPPMHVMAAADELVRHLGAEADPLGERSSLMILARAGALALMNRIELNGSVQAQPSHR